jgi:hypothetical protein
MTDPTPRKGEVAVNQEALDATLEELEGRGLMPKSFFKDTRTVSRWCPPPDERKGKPPRKAFNAKTEQLDYVINTANAALERQQHLTPEAKPFVIDRERLVGRGRPPRYDDFATILKGSYERVSIPGISPSRGAVILREIFVEPSLTWLSSARVSLQFTDFDGLKAQVVDRHHPALLLGSAGSGKTLVLAALARDLISSKRLVLHVSLAGYVGGALSDHILKKLAERLRSELTDEHRELVRRALVHKRSHDGLPDVLLLLDDLHLLTSATQKELELELKKVEGQAKALLASRRSPWVLDEDGRFGASSLSDHYFLEPFSMEKVRRLLKNIAALVGQSLPPALPQTHIPSSLHKLLGVPFHAMLYTTWSEQGPPRRADLVEHVILGFFATKSKPGQEAAADPLATRVAAEWLALTITRRDSTGQTSRRFDGIVHDAARTMHFRGDKNTIDSSASAIIKQMFDGGLLNAPEDEKRVSWSHDVFREHLASAALFRECIYDGGVNELASFVVQHHESSVWRDVLLSGIGQHRHDGALIDPIAQRLMAAAQNESWDATTFLVLMLREGASPTSVDALSIVRVFWKVSRRRPWRQVLPYRDDLWHAMDSLSAEASNAVGNWVEHEIGRLDVEALERFVLVLMPSDDPSHALLRRVEKEPEVRDLLWRLWPARKLIVSMNVHAWPVPPEIGIELVALRCVVCAKEQWRAGTLRFLLLLLERMAWTARASLDGLRDGALPLGFAVSDGEGSLPITLLPALVPELANHQPHEARDISQADKDVFENLLELLERMLRTSSAALPAMKPHSDIIETFIKSAKQHYPARLAAMVFARQARMPPSQSQLRWAVQHCIPKGKTVEPSYREELERLAALDASAYRTITSLVDLYAQPQPTAPWNTPNLLTLTTYGAHAMDVLTAALLVPAAPESTPPASSRAVFEGQDSDDHANAGKRSSRERYVLPAVRAQNRWLLLFLEVLLVNVDEKPELDALILALGLSVYQTTWTWPSGDRWTKLAGPKSRPPAESLPRFVWYQCKAIANRSNAAEYLDSAVVALREASSKDPEGLPKVFVESLRTAMVRPVTQADVTALQSTVSRTAQARV